MLSLRALEVLVAVADTGSVSAAARLLHLSQPAISHQLTGLERECGAALVDRTSRGTTLTRRGRAMIVHARAALDAASRAVESARSSEGEEPIRLAAAESFTLPYVVPVASRWHAHGRVPLRLSEASSARVLVARVRDGSADLAIVPGPLEADGLHVTRIGTERIVAVGPRVSSLRPATLKAVSDHTLIGVDTSNGFGEWLAQRFAHAGLAYAPSVIVRSVHKAAALADAGFGTAVVPASAVTPPLTAVGLEPALERPLLAVSRTEQDPAVRELIGSFVRHLSDLADATAESRVR